MSNLSAAYFNEDFEIFNSNEELKNNSNKMVDLYPSIDLDPDESFQQPPTKKHHFSKLETMDLNLENLISNKNNMVSENNKLLKYQTNNDQHFFNCLQYQPVNNQNFDSSINNYSHLVNYIEENNNIPNMAYQKYTYQNVVTTNKEDSMSNYVSTVKNSNSVTKILPKQMTNDSSCLANFNMNDSKDPTDYNQYFNPYENYNTINSMQDINNSNINQNIDSHINFNQNNNLQLNFTQNPNRHLNYNENLNNNDLINNDINKTQNNLLQNTIHNNHNSLLNQVNSSPVSLQKSPLSTNSFVEDSVTSPLDSSLKIDLNETTKTVESKKKRVYIPVSKFKFSAYIETKPEGELMNVLVNEIVNFVFEYVPMNRKTPKPIDGLLGFIIGRYPILAEENRTGFDSLKSLVHVEMKRRMNNQTRFDTKTQISD